ncbi:DUF4439 domain-containing protein [Brachybacterium paraconglomeratum]|uniref:DUF4439 domain-containing protein n=1 Tax=Brachybacterium paraconglomeratum TaxID=173362 RepID=UPI0031EDB11A
MSLIARSLPTLPAPTRRGVLQIAVGALVVLPLASCGRVILGGPEKYTPPPPGIDDLYRIELLTLMDQVIAGTDQVMQALDPATGEPAPSAALTALSAALPIQRTALLTGAQHERELEAEDDPAPGQTAPPPPAGAPTDIAGLLVALVELRDLAAAAARQVSGSLARPLAAIASHTAWIMLRLQAAAGTGEVTPAPSAEELVPSREVPTTDPPSIGAQADYHTVIEQTQQEEWFAGYLHEVLAARVQDDARQQHLDQADLHRTRAEQLGRIAEEDGAPVVSRQAVYAIPGGTLDPELAGELPTLLSQGLLMNHVALVGAAPFERRPLPIAAALAEAERLAALVNRMDPLPTLKVEELPVGG